MNSKTIFITGASGFLGSHLVIQFLLETDCRLLCLVRKKGGVGGIQRLNNAILEILSDYKLSFEWFEKIKNRIKVVEGDVLIEGLGLAPLVELGNINEIIHAACKIDFSENRSEETITQNHAGTQRIIEFANQYNVPIINYISTAYVAGKKSGEINECDFDSDYATNNPYEESKRLCEKLILNANHHFRIFRPSIIVGHSDSLKSTSNTGLYGFLSMLCKVKHDIQDKMPDYFSETPLSLYFEENVTVNLIPVDVASKRIIEVLKQDSAPNQVVHVTSSTPIDIKRLFLIACEVLGVQCRLVEHINDLNPIDFIVHTQTNIFSCYLTNMKTFSQNNLKSLVDIKEHPITDNMLTGYMHEFYSDFKKRWNEKSKRDITSKILTRKDIMISENQYLSYFSGGENNSQTLVIINAFGQSLSFWDRIIGNLLQQFHVIIWQSRGTTSKSGGLDSALPLLEHVNDLKRIVDAEDVKSFHVLGWCTGPKLALEFQSRYPKQVKSMTFLTGAFKGTAGTQSADTLYEKSMEPLCRLVAANPEVAGSLLEYLKAVLTGKSIAFGTDSLSDSKRYVSDVLSLINKNLKPLVIEPFLNEKSVVCYARQLLDFWSYDISDLAKNVRIPTLFITSELDTIASSASSDAVHQLIPNSIYVEIQGATHYPHYEQPELLLDLLSFFIQKRDLNHFSHPLLTVKLRTENHLHV